jgi:hypothetical protein
MFAVPSGTDIHTYLYFDDGTREKMFEKHWRTVIWCKTSE